MRISLDLISRATTHRRRKEEEDKNFLKRLTHVNLSDKKIDVIEGLEGCVNLQCLYLTDNRQLLFKRPLYGDIARALTFENFRIRMIENLGFAQNLTHLYLQDNQIEVMENFEPLYNLQKLFIGGNAIQEIRGLEACSNLQELHVQAQRLPPARISPKSSIQ